MSLRRKSPLAAPWTAPSYCFWCSLRFVANGSYWGARSTWWHVCWKPTTSLFAHTLHTPQHSNITPTSHSSIQYCSRNTFCAPSTWQVGKKKKLKSKTDGWGWTYNLIFIRKSEFALRLSLHARHEFIWVFYSSLPYVLVWNVVFILLRISQSRLCALRRLLASFMLWYISTDSYSYDWNIQPISQLSADLQWVVYSISL